MWIMKERNHRQFSKVFNSNLTSAASKTSSCRPKKSTWIRIEKESEWRVWSINKLPTRHIQMWITPMSTINHSRTNRSNINLGTQNHLCNQEEPMNNFQRASQKLNFISPITKRDLPNLVKITICKSSRSIVVSSSSNLEVHRSWCTRRLKGIGKLSTSLTMVIIVMLSTSQVRGNNLKFQPICSIQMTDHRLQQNLVRWARRLPRHRSPPKKNWKSSWISRCSKLKCWWISNNS